MASVSPGHPESAVDGDPATRVPQPRAPTHDTVRDGDALNPIAQARVRESAARNNAAAELFETGQHDEAVPLFEQALASCRSTLGGDHPDTLIVAGNLAVAYVAAGNRRKGIKLIAGNLAARVRVFGDEHPETLTARNALAVAHRINGDVGHRGGAGQAGRGAAQPDAGARARRHPHLAHGPRAGHGGRRSPDHRPRPRRLRR